MQGFIKTRLNKDNFWNLMFLILTSIAVYIAQEIMDLIPGGTALLLATIILSPYLASRTNKVVHKDDMFHSTSTKRSLCQYMPEAVGFVLWSTIPFTAFWVLYFFDEIPNLAVYNLIFWFVPTMYFILKNLPLAIIFNKTAWTKQDPAAMLDSADDDWTSNSHHFSTFDSKVTSMSYDYLPGNIHHTSYLNRYYK